MAGWNVLKSFLLFAWSCIFMNYDDWLIMIWLNMIYLCDLYAIFKYYIRDLTLVVLQFANIETKTPRPMSLPPGRLPSWKRGSQRGGPLCCTWWLVTGARAMRVTQTMVGHVSTEMMGFNQWIKWINESIFIEFIEWINQFQWIKWIHLYNSLTFFFNVGKGIYYI